MSRYIPCMDLIVEMNPLPDLPEIFLAMGVTAADFMWHLADIEATAWPQGINEGWLSGADLLAHGVPGETCFIWGVLDAFQPGPTFAVSDIPWADGNTTFWRGQPLKPQLSGAIFEIVFWDGRAVLLIGLDEIQGASVIRALPGAKRLNAGSVT